MTAFDHIRVFKERWLSIVATMLVGVAVGILVYVLQAEKYTASLQMYVSSPVPADSESSFLSAAQVAQDRVLSYTELATSPRVTATVVQELALPMSAEDLARNIEANATDKSVVMTISVTDRSAEGAAAIANAVGNALRATVNDVERSQAPGAVPPISVRAVEPAPVPTEPSSLGVRRLGGIGLLVGLAAGVAMALARNALDNSIKSVTQLAELSGAPNLGSIRYGSKFAKQPLVVQDDPQGGVAEDFKRLRTNIQFVDVENDHKVLVVSSALPDEGKTTTTVNLAAALASAGNRVLLIDGDLRRPRAAQILGTNPEVGVTSVLARRTGLDSAIQVSRSGRFDVLAPGPLPPNPSELLACRQMQELIADVRRRYDLVLVDTPPLLPVADAAAVAPLTDGVILVCRHQRTTRNQVVAATAAVRSVGVELRGTVLTMTDQSALGIPAYARTYSSEGVSSIDLTPVPSVQTPVHGEESTRTLDRSPATQSRPQPSPGRRGNDGVYGSSRAGR